MSELTPWFPMDINPVRTGVYIVDQSYRDDGVRESVYSYWCGKYWYPQDSTASGAMRWICYGPNKGGHFRGWRGLKDQPKTQKEDV